MSPQLIGSVVVALLAGGAVGFFIRRVTAGKKIATAEAQAEKILSDVKAREQEALIKAREKALTIIDEGKKEEAKRRAEITELQSRLEKREASFDQKLSELDRKSTALEEKKQSLEEETKRLEENRADIEALKKLEQEKLQEVSGLTKDEAVARLEKMVQEEYSDALASRLRKLEQINEEELEAKSRQILSLAITRFAAGQSVDTTTSSVELPSDEMKGRIIGKEGRNIKAVELLTGTEIIVDETPNMITISCFSPIRRQVAKLALEELIKDGRIQPARIEEAIKNAKQILSKEIRKAGEEALIELGIPVSSIDPKLVQILGRMKYRTSYGQNALQHSIEVATLAGLIGAELGADVFNCKKGGLFHDIGKAVDHDMQGAHPEIGYNILKKFGWPEELCYQSVAHHEDRPRTIEGAIVKAADAISGARPGARKNSLEQFIQRMEALEKTASSFDGVEKVYAIQAGREVRVFVEPKVIDDLTAFRLANDIAKKIEAELQYPGEVKVTVIRETRVVEYAR